MQENDEIPQPEDVNINVEIVQQTGNIYRIEGKDLRTDQHIIKTDGGSQLIGDTFYHREVLRRWIESLEDTNKLKEVTTGQFIEFIEGAPEMFVKSHLRILDVSGSEEGDLSEDVSIDALADEITDIASDEEVGDVAAEEVQMDSAQRQIIRQYPEIINKLIERIRKESNTGQIQSAVRELREIDNHLKELGNETTSLHNISLPRLKNELENVLKERDNETGRESDSSPGWNKESVREDDSLGDEVSAQ